MYREQLACVAAPEAASAFSSNKVLIVIPCLNEQAHIGALVTAMREDTAELDRLIVVADGGSTDGTPSIVADIAARETCVRLIANRRKIQSAGVNLAVRIFGGGYQWLVRLDAHAHYPRGYVRQLIAEANRTGAASVVVAMTSQGTGGFQSAVASVQNSLLGAGGARHRRSGSAGFVDHGHHALFALKRFVAIGGYDEAVSHNEDADFDIRLARTGGKIWLTRAVEIGYFPRADLRELYRQYMNYGRGRAATIVRHRKLPKLRQVLPACVSPAIAALLYAPWDPIAAAPVAAWVALCLLFGAALGIRQGPRYATFAIAAAMIIHLAWSIGFWRELLSRSRHDKDARFGGAPHASNAAS
jgi:succinoglycan biosynthesis protein ExoA